MRFSSSDGWFCLLVIALMCLAIPIKITKKSDSISDEFENFIIRYNKSYHKSDSEYEKRYNIFKKSVETTHHLNAERRDLNDANYGITVLSDLSDIEFTEKCLGFISKKDDKPLSAGKLRNLHRIFGIKVCNTLPLQVDWREKGVTTQVRDQGSCGSCYAHSIIATVESLLAIKLKLPSPIELSVQQLLDCSQNFTKGCLGGNTCELLGWLQKEKIKILPNEIYPPSPTIQQCRTEAIFNNLPTQPKTVRITNSVCLNFTGNEFKMLDILARYGPLTASVDATLWKNYLGGVIKYHCNGPINHAVQIVGYDLTDENPFYIIRNSWGRSFGNDGFAKVAIGGNTCGIASVVSIINISYG